MPQYVKLVNKDDRPFDFHHHNKKRIIKPGADTAVPWDLACTLFGDPYVLDDGKRNDRTRTIKQVRGNFGYQSGMMTEDEWEAIRPHVEVYDLETNERVYMLLEDPEGLHSLPDAEDVDQADQVAFLTRQLAQLQATLAAVVERQRETEQDAKPDESVVPVTGTGQGQISAPSQDAPNLPTVPPDKLNDPAAYVLNVSNPPESNPAPTKGKGKAKDAVGEDTPHTPTLPPRPQG